MLKYAAVIKCGSDKRYITMSHRPCRILGLPGEHRNWGWRKGKEKMLVVMGMHSQEERKPVVNVLFINSMQFYIP